jgi:hypothetical protein
MSIKAHPWVCRNRCVVPYMEPSASDVTQPDEVLTKAYARLAACGSEDGRVAATADLILAIFDQFYRQLCEYPYRAKRAFEAKDPASLPGAGR